jgi:hypothetical protein
MVSGFVFRVKKKLKILLICVYLRTILLELSY